MLRPIDCADEVVLMTGEMDGSVDDEEQWICGACTFRNIVLGTDST